MHYIDRARELKRECDKLNITPYEYARVKGLTRTAVTNYTRILRLGTIVCNHIKKKSMGIGKSGQLLRIRNIRDDEFLIKVINLDKIKKFDYYKFKRMIEKELERG